MEHLMASTESFDLAVVTLEGCLVLILPWPLLGVAPKLLEVAAVQTSAELAKPPVFCGDEH